MLFLDIVGCFYNIGILESKTFREINIWEADVWQECSFSYSLCFYWPIVKSIDNCGML